PARHGILHFEYFNRMDDRSLRPNRTMSGKCEEAVFQKKKELESRDPQAQGGGGYQQSACSRRAHHVATYPTRMVAKAIIALAASRSATAKSTRSKVLSIPGEV